MIVLAVNQRSEPVACIALYAFPDIEHRSAGCIHHDASDSAKRFEVMNCHSERGEYYNVCRRNFAVVDAIWADLQNFDSHIAQFRVHVRIMDYLASEKNLAVRKLLSSLIRIVHGPFDAVAEPEFAGEPDGGIAGLKAEIAAAEQVDQPSIIVSRKLRLDLGLEPKTLPKVDVRARALPYGGLG